MILRTLVVGPIQANCYILGCERTREAAVIDPGGDSDKILIALAKDNRARSVANFGLKIIDLTTPF